MEFNSAFKGLSWQMLTAFAAELLCRRIQPANVFYVRWIHYCWGIMFGSVLVIFRHSFII